MHTIAPAQLELPTVFTPSQWEPLTPLHSRQLSHTNASERPPASHTPVVLSVFPGIDLLGMAFEQEGYCIVRGPDPIFGGDIRNFAPPPNVFHGIIGGSPCPDFSKARRSAPTGEGLEMLRQWTRVVTAAKPHWAMLENVPGVPDVEIDGYRRQRIDVRGTEVGILQRRIRHFQFFSRDPKPLAVPRRDTPGPTVRAVTATEARHTHRRTWAEFCALQGLTPAPHLDGMTKSARYRAIGNGVPLPMGRLLARSIRTWSVTTKHFLLCICGCGREVRPRQISATAACRKRIERRRHSHTTSTGKGVPTCSETDPPLF